MSPSPVSIVSTQTVSMSRLQRFDTVSLYRLQRFDTNSLHFPSSTFRHKLSPYTAFNISTLFPYTAFNISTQLSPYTVFNISTLTVSRYRLQHFDTNCLHIPSSALDTNCLHIPFSTFRHKMSPYTVFYSGTHFPCFFFEAVIQYRQVTPLPAHSTAVAFRPIQSRQVTPFPAHSTAVAFRPIQSRKCLTLDFISWN